MPESTIFLGEVPIAPYGMPSTPEIPDAIEPFFSSYDAVLLENHGALAWGIDLLGAYFKMEGLEFYAQLSYITQMMGGPKELPAHEVQRLVDLRKGMNLPGKHPCIDGNQDCGGAEKTICASVKAETTNDQDLIAKITREVITQLNK